MASDDMKYVFERITLEEYGMDVEDHQSAWTVNLDVLNPLLNLFSREVLPSISDISVVQRTAEAFHLLHRFNLLDHSEEDQERLEATISNFVAAGHRTYMDTDLGASGAALPTLSHDLCRTGIDSAINAVTGSLEYALGNVVKEIFPKAYDLQRYFERVLLLARSQDVHKRTNAPLIATAVATAAIALIRVIRVSKLMKIFGTPSDRTPNYHNFSWREIARELNPEGVRDPMAEFPGLAEIEQAFKSAAILEGVVEFYKTRQRMSATAVEFFGNAEWEGQMNTWSQIDNAARMIGLE